MVSNSAANSPYIAETDRYVLIVASGCPFASRTWATMLLLGLEHCFRIVKVFPGNLSDGWFFEAISEEEKNLVAKHPEIKWDSFHDGEENITHLKRLYLK